MPRIQPRRPRWADVERARLREEVDREDAAKGGFGQNLLATICTNAQLFGDLRQKSRLKLPREWHSSLGEMLPPKSRWCLGRPAGQENERMLANSGGGTQKSRSTAQIGSYGTNQDSQHCLAACAWISLGQAEYHNIGIQETGTYPETRCQFETEEAKGWIWAAKFVTRLSLRSSSTRDFGLHRTLVKSVRWRPFFSRWWHLRCQGGWGLRPQTPEV